GEKRGRFALSRLRAAISPCYQGATRLATVQWRSSMRIGIIGLKGHQSVVLKGAEQLGNCQVVAASDDDPKELKSLLKQPLAKDAETYADWRMLLEHTMMDVCVVADENGMRAEQLLALAERNIHIITEKPLTTNLADLARVRAAVDKSKSRL